MKITPIKIPYICEALNVSPVEAVEEYAVWGGVPRYWELREMYSSLYEAIESNLLSVNGTLYEEPLKLFEDDIKDIVKTATIMSYVGAGANRLSEIAARCGEVAESFDKKHLLVGECKWTSGENSDRLLAELKTKANQLSFAKDHIIIPKLFLKYPPVETTENVLLPDNIIT